MRVTRETCIPNFSCNVVLFFKTYSTPLFISKEIFVDILIVFYISWNEIFKIYQLTFFFFFLKYCKFTDWLTISNLEESGVEVDLLEHAEQISQSGAKWVESAEDVLLAKAELADVLPHLAVFDPGVGIFVTLWTILHLLLWLPRI